MKAVINRPMYLVCLVLISLVTVSFGFPFIEASPGVVRAAPRAATHVVQTGDTLYSIARQYSTTVPAIMAANGLTNPDFIWVGQRLIIPSTVTPTLPAGCNVVHIVQRGETLYSVARRYGTSVAAVVAASNIANPNFIWIGQRLTVPVCGTPTLVPPSTSPTSTQNRPTPDDSPTPVEPTSTPSPTATGVGASPTPTPSPTSGSGCELIYIVVRYDTVSSIARHFGTTVATIVAANNLPSPDFIWVGQRLVIPVCSTPVPTTEPPAGGDRWIDVNLSSQTLIAYQGSTPVLHTLISAGTAQHPSPVGTFHVYLKLVSQDMYGPGYYLPDVPYVMYFYSGYAIHGAYWHNNFGHPMSHGCINLPIPEAGWLFQWSPMGIPVVLHY